jgi:hypothetical protein
LADVLLCCVIHYLQETVPKCCSKTILLSQTSMFWFSLSNFNLHDHILSTAGAALATVLLEEVYQVWSQFLICKSLAWEVNGFCRSKPDWVLAYIASSEPAKWSNVTSIPHVDDLELTRFFLLCLGMNSWSELN